MASEVNMCTGWAKSHATSDSLYSKRINRIMEFSCQTTHMRKIRRCGVTFGPPFVTPYSLSIVIDLGHSKFEAYLLSNLT